MEGVAFDLRQSLECFKGLGLPAEELRIGEGGARSALWRQIQADVFGQDVRVLEVEDASALGAAIIAAIGVEMYTDFESGCGRAVGLGETVPVRCGAGAALRGVLPTLQQALSEHEGLVSRFGRPERGSELSAYQREDYLL